MKANIIPLIVGLLVFFQPLILKDRTLCSSNRDYPQVVAGNLGLMPEEWMLYLAGFGGIILTFLAGAEIDTKLMKERFKESLLIGAASFLTPFLAASLFTYYAVGWSLSASLIAGITLSETSIAVVYSVLVETDLSRTRTGKMIMAATFMTNMGTALALSILFIKPNLYTFIFIAVSIIVIILATRFSHYVFDNPRLKNKVIEPEIKYIFLLLLVFMYFANLGEGHAILPAFVLGLLMSRHFTETSEARVVKNRLRTVAFAIITPVFFIVVGMKVSLPLIVSASGIFIALFSYQTGSQIPRRLFFCKEIYTEWKGLHPSCLAQA